MSGFKEAEEAAAFVRGRSKLRPVLGLVLGSGLGAFADSLKGATHIPFAEIPHFPTSTAIGHRGELVLGVAADTPVAVMNGRVHFYEGYSPAQVVFPVRVLGRLGIKTIVMTNAAGSVNVNYKPGELMVIEGPASGGSALRNASLYSLYGTLPSPKTVYAISPFHTSTWLL